MPAEDQRKFAVTIRSGPVAVNSLEELKSTDAFAYCEMSVGDMDRKFANGILAPADAIERRLQVVRLPNGMRWPSTLHQKQSSARTKLYLRPMDEMSQKREMETLSRLK